MKVGVSFQEYVSCDNIVTSEVQTLEQMMVEKFAPDASGEEEDGDWKKLICSNIFVSPCGHGR